MQSHVGTLVTRPTVLLLMDMQRQWIEPDVSGQRKQTDLALELLEVMHCQISAPKAVLAE